MSDSNKPAKGRGRGRGRGAMMHGASPKPGGNPTPTAPAPETPGSPPSTVTDTVPQPDTSVTSNVKEQRNEDNIATMLASQVASLSIHSGKKDVEDFVRSQKTESDEQLTQLAVSLYDRCQQDWQFAKTASLVCREVISSVPKGNTLRSQILTSMKTDFGTKDTLRHENEQKFLGCLAILCQFLAKVKVASGAHMIPLVTPALDALDILLDNKATADEMKCASKQLLACGPILKQENSQRMRDIIQKVRNCILDERGNKESRLMLIDVIEANASEWTLHVDVD